MDVRLTVVRFLPEVIPLQTAQTSSSVWTTSYTTDTETGFNGSKVARAPTWPLTWLRRLVAALSSRRKGFIPWPYSVWNFVADTVASWQIFRRAFGLPDSIILPVLHTPSFIYHNDYLNSLTDSIFRLNSSLKTFTKATNVQRYASSPPHAFMAYTGTILRFYSTTIFIVSPLKGQGKNRAQTLYDDYQQLVCFVVWPDTNLTMLHETYSLHLLQWRGRQCFPTKGKWICARLNTVTSLKTEFSVVSTVRTPNLAVTEQVWEKSAA